MCGAFAGPGHEADRAALTHAGREAVAFALKDGLDALAAEGSEVAAITAVGDGRGSTFWLPVPARALERPIGLPAAGDVDAAFGAVRLAMKAAGIPADDAWFGSPPAPP